MRTRGNYNRYDNFCAYPVTYVVRRCGNGCSFAAGTFPGLTNFREAGGVVR